MKKLISLVLALAMILMVSAAFADITITNTNSRISISGKTYNAYKLFDSTHVGSAYSYTMSTSSEFYSANLLLAADDANAPTTGLAKLLRDNFTFTALAGDTSKVNVVVKNGFNARAFADAMKPYLTGKTVTKSATVPEGAETVTIDADDYGYYLVTGEADATDPAVASSDEGTTGLVSAIILTNEDPDVDIQPKADAPTLNKKITAVSDGGQVLDDDGLAAVAKVGQTVSFELDAVVPDLTGYDHYTYTFHDTMSSGLDYVTDSFVLKINNVEVDIAPTISGRSFTLTIPYNTLKNYSKNTPVKLTYNATVNNNALTYDKENNTANLEYSNNPYDTTTEHTPDDKVYVIDINLDVDKVNANGDHLANASFKLYRVNADESKTYYKWDNNVVTWVTETNAQVFTTDSTGHLTSKIQGLDKGTYYLVETAAPAGYNPLPDPITITISVSEASNKVTYTATFNSDSATMTNGEVDLTTAQQQNKQPLATGAVLNQTGTILPSTGGIGTTIFYILGGLLVIGAAVILVARRKAHD